VGGGRASKKSLATFGQRSNPRRPAHTQPNGIILITVDIRQAAKTIIGDGDGDGSGVSASDQLVLALHSIVAGEKFDQPDGERSMKKTIEIFNTLTGHNLTTSDGWLLRVCSGMVKDQAGPVSSARSATAMIASASLYAESRAYCQ